MIRFILRRALLATLLALTGAATADTTDEAPLLTQRALYQQARAQLQRGQLDAAAIGIAALQNYPLLPYLELQLLTANIQNLNAVDNHNNTAIDEFLRRYRGSLVAEQLRNTWLAELAKHGRWAEYRSYYAVDDSGKNPNGKLQQCWSLEALYQTQQFDAALKETSALWLNTDLPDACDEPLKRWLSSAQRSEPLVWQRLLLALEQKQEQYARLLVVNIREPYKLSAEYALLLYRDPTALNSLLPVLTPLPEAGSVMTLTLKNLAKRDADSATTLWQQLAAAGQLSSAESSAVRAAIGRQQIALRGIDALPWLLQYDANGEDSYLLEWRVRLALRTTDWPTLARWIEQLPTNLLQTPRWSYWHARALAAQSDAPEQQQRGTALLRELAKDRSFYGFLAADQVKTDYQLNDQRLLPQITPQTLALQPALLRARELYAIGEAAAARREWLYALRSMNSDEQLSAALLAAQWDWHDRAIQTATQAGAWNDLQLRFPLAYRTAMLEAATNTALPSPWLFAIARQESTFMPDARSPVGALGLMQLMPDTARQVARSLRTSVATEQLLQPHPNIRLGSKYLSEMLHRYRGNRVLATAAYNAGPTRISRLLANQKASVPADIWIETLPYRETREYVQNVLAFSVIYSRRLGMTGPLLAHNEITIDSPLQVGSTNN